MNRYMKKHKPGNLPVIEEIYSHIPAFSDIFTEETFYAFAVCFVLVTLLVVFILSRFITIKPVD